MRHRGWLAVAATVGALVGGGGEVSAAPRDEVAAPEQGGEEAEPLIANLEGMRWGMTPDEVLAHAEEMLKARYKPLIRKASGILEEDRLYQRMRTEMQNIRDSFIAFDGAATGWDVSPIKEEFRHGSGEAMLVVQEERARTFYFFIRNRLWKCVKMLDEQISRAQPWDVFQQALEQRFGDARHEEEVSADGGPPRSWIQWQDADTRLRALRLGAQYALAFEAGRVVERLADLRKHARPRRQKRHEVLEAVLLDGHSYEHVAEDPHDAVAERIAEQLRRQQQSP